MIRNVYLIHESGLCLFSRSYGDNSQDEDLFSGLLVAVTSFVKYLTGEKINEIRMDQHNIFYDSKNEITLALITSKKRISRQRMSTIMRKIFKSFNDLYREYLKQQILEPDNFIQFTPILDKMLQSSKLVKKQPQRGIKPISRIHKKTNQLKVPIRE